MNADEVIDRACAHAQAALVFGTELRLSQTRYAARWRVELFLSGVHPLCAEIDDAAMAEGALCAVVAVARDLDGRMFEQLFSRAVALAPLLGPSRARSGSGAPYEFQCWRCRRSSLIAVAVELTGRTRLYRTGNRPRVGPRSAPVQRQYRCLQCGHVGWSNHQKLAKGNT